MSFSVRSIEGRSNPALDETEANAVIALRELEENPHHARGVGKPE
jgi:hypothetical protein